MRAAAFPSFFSFVLLALAGCGGSSPPPAMQGKAGMLSQTAVAQKCEDAARGHDRPFVVEWDATDLASFETKAARDTVVVKYQGCTLDVLYGCSDAIAGHFGSYGTPHATSGAIQGFDIANDGDLYAKLPLGAAQLSGRVEAGESLHLRYFVSGVATDTRDALYGDDLAKIPACAGATHFVWAYNLGAFELGTHEANAEKAGTGVGSFSAGGDSSHSAASLAQGGDIASCTTNDQRACRVPIRLALRPITAGASPAATLPSAANGQMSAVPSGADTYAGTPAGQAAQAIKDARKAEDAGDGAGCLALLDRAAGLDAAQADNRSFRVTHAECRMTAGECDAGRVDYRATLAAADENHVKSDQELDRETTDLGNVFCASKGTKADNDFVLRAAREMNQAAAAATPDGDRCAQLFEAIDAHLPGAKKLDMAARNAGFPRSRYSTSAGQMALDRGAFCIAAAKGCKAGYPYYLRSYREKLPGSSAADNAALDSWQTMQRLGQIVCK